MTQILVCGFDGNRCEEQCALFRPCPRAGGRNPVVDAERERAAKIADDYARRAMAAHPSAQEAAVAAEHIAAEIRRGDTEESPI